MSSLYRRLATVDFLHDYFSDGRVRELQVVPSADCTRKMQAAGIVWRLIGSTLVLLIKVRSDGNVRASVPQDMALRFYLAPQSDNFFTVSNLPYDAQGDERFFFTARTGGEDDGSLYLSQPTSAYNGSKTYGVGDIVQAGGTLFEAIRPSGGDLAAHTTGETDWWMPKDAGHYAGSADLIRFTGAHFSFPVEPATASVTTTVWAENPETGAFDVIARAAETEDWMEPQSAVNVSLHGLRPGRYRIDVNGAERIVYLDDEAVSRKVFAVLEIPIGLAPGHTHGLFAGDGTVRSPRYTLRIPARRLRWKYIARTVDVEDIADQNQIVSARYHFDADGPLCFLSTVPIALREAPLTSFFLQSSLLGDVGPIASASPYGLGTCSVGGDVLPCAEIRLNY